jgi:LysM repeat protein
MRRMTISRSNRAAWAALVAVPLLCAPLRAQDSTHAAPPAQDTVRSPALPALPPTHTVAKGETLWSISRLYYNDPLLWPEVYRVNTTVIEDPHWIYPGQVLQIAGAADTTPPPDTTKTVAQGPPPDTTVKTVAQAPAPSDTVHADTTHAAPDTTVKADTGAAVKVDTGAVAAPPAADTAMAAPPPPPPSNTNGTATIFDRPASPTQQVENTLRAYLHQPYRPVRHGEFYTAGWLTEGEHLPWGSVIGNTARPAIHKLSDRTSAARYEEVAIQPPGDASYHVGDSLLLARIDREVSGWGGVVTPLGIARVTSVQSQQVLALVINQYGRIHDGSLVLPLEPFKDPGEVRPAAVSQGLEGHIIASRDQRPLAGAQDIYFIDRGRAEGVVPGDMFEAYRPAAGTVGTASEQVLLQILIVHTREHSASGLVVGVLNPDVKPGSSVRLIRKMPS